MLSNTPHENPPEIYGVTIFLKLNLWIIIYTFQKASKEPHRSMFICLKKSEIIGRSMQIAVTVTQDSHDPIAHLQIYSSRYCTCITSNKNSLGKCHLH